MLSLGIILDVVDIVYSFCFCRGYILEVGRENE